MKINFVLLSMSTLVMTTLCCGCVRDNVDQKNNKAEESTTRSLSSILTRSSDNVVVDDNVAMSIQQSDHDNFMMSRVLFRNNKYELCLKREDAIFFGVDNDLYDEYVSYVEKLNETLEL